MDQRHLFFETLEQALGDDIRALGGPKAVAMRLRPELKPHEAHVWLNNALNPERRELMHHNHIRLIIRMAREVGAHAANDFWNDDVGYERPRALNPVDEATEILLRQEKLLAEFRRENDRMERLSRAPMSLVGKPA